MQVVTYNLPVPEVPWFRKPRPELSRECGAREGRYLGGVPGLVLQGPREDVVAQVEEQEADDDQRAHAGPHDLPVPVQRAASHGLQVTCKSAWETREKV